MQELCKVLIVDDCEEDCAVYRRYLQAESKTVQYDIQVTSSAEDALALPEQSPFDVILLDYELPELSGLEFLIWPKPPALSSAAIIMLSAFGDEMVAVKALKQGAQDYLVKQSLTADILANSIRVAINQVRLRQQLQQSQERQQLISSIALKIRDTLELSKILETSVVEIRQLLKCDRVLIVKQADQGHREVVAESVQPDCQAASSIFNPLQYSPQPQAMMSRQDGLNICGIDDVASANLEPEIVQTLEALGVVSLLEIPIAIEGSSSTVPTLWGALVLHECKPRSWQMEEQEMLLELGIHLAIAIQQSELLTQTQCALLKEQELNQFKSKIVATVSHEYRTPITSILASSATLERHFGKLDTTQSQRLLTLISQQARHLRELVDDMLVVNQVELGQVQFKPFPLNLEQFFERLIEQYQVMALETHHISLEIEGNCDAFIGDFGLCRQIFGNLLSNSIKYSPNGGPIRLSVNYLERDVIVRIRDHGIGIPAIDLPQLFQSFTRGSNVDTIQGTGLGLSIAKACVDLHQGKLTLTSQEGQYTEAQVSLPKQPQFADV